LSLLFASDIAKASFDFGLVLQSTRGDVLRIGTKFEISNREDGVVHGVDSGEPSRSMLALLAGPVSSVEWTELGALTVTYPSGISLHVEPDAAYEAWTLASAGGELVIASPGGGIVSFPAPR